MGKKLQRSVMKATPTNRCICLKHDHLHAHAAPGGAGKTFRGSGAINMALILRLRKVMSEIEPPRHQGHQAGGEFRAKSARKAKPAKSINLTDYFARKLFMPSHP